MKKEAKVALGMGAGLAVLAGVLVFTTTGKAKAAPWDPTQLPKAAEKKRFFKSFEISPNQPQEIWVYVLGAFTTQSESWNPTTGFWSFSDRRTYSSDPEASRPVFDYLISSVGMLNDQAAMQLAEIVTLFNLRR